MIFFLKINQIFIRPYRADACTGVLWRIICMYLSSMSSQLQSNCILVKKKKLCWYLRCCETFVPISALRPSPILTSLHLFLQELYHHPLFLIFFNQVCIYLTFKCYLSQGSCLRTHVPNPLPKISNTFRSDAEQQQQYLYFAWWRRFLGGPGVRGRHDGQPFRLHVATALLHVHILPTGVPLRPSPRWPHERAPPRSCEAARSAAVAPLPAPAFICDIYPNGPRFRRQWIVPSLPFT